MFIFDADKAHRPPGTADEWDSGNQFDISVTRKEEGKPDKTKMIEVKGTTGSQPRFFLSAFEQQIALRKSSVQHQNCD